MSARPARIVEADMAIDEKGNGKLTVPLAPPRQLSWLLRYPGTATKTFEFDPLGVFVWQTIDGKSDVRQVIRKLAKRYNLNLREAEVSTLHFLSLLAKKGLIGLAVNESAKTKQPQA